MPVYVYRNLRTGEKFEVEQRITEPALTEHPESGDPVKRLIQPVGITFKGSGFYVTDSRNASNGSSGKKAGGEATGASDSKVESKAATDAGMSGGEKGSAAAKSSD